MSSNPGGPIPNGPDLFTQQSMKAQSSGRESAKTMDDLITQILEGPVKWFSKMAGVNVTSMFNTGIFAHVKIEDAAIKSGESINKGAASLSAQGGALARELGVAFNKPDFGGITAAHIEGMPIEAQQQIASIRDMVGEGMPVSAMSYGELGNLVPSSGGNISRGEGMGMMA